LSERAFDAGGVCLGVGTCSGGVVREYLSDGFLSYLLTAYTVPLPALHQLASDA